ncbi:MAG: hypothetical protein N4A63_17310 [Vallitalea sp.]|jgi:hypothetical protein|nr:hypothetical protein [Vallitalea sp.]
MEMMRFETIKDNINNNKDLEKTLGELAIIQQHNHYKYSLYNFIFNYITFLEMINEEDNKIIEIDNKGEDIINYMTSLLSDYKCLESIQLSTEELIRFRDLLEAKIDTLSSYTDETLLYEYKLNRIEGKFKNNYYDIEEDESFAGRLIKFIFENEDNIVINEKIKMILSQLPVRITKTKFFEYVDNSLEIYKGAYVSDLNNFIKMIGDSISFYPQSDDSFKNIRDDISTLKNVDYNTINNKEFQEISDLKIQIAMKIGLVHTVYTMAVETINNLIEISFCDKLSNFVEDKDLTTANSLLKMISNYMEEVEHNVDFITSLENVEGIIENGMNVIQKYSRLIEVVFNKYKKQLEAYNLLKTYENIQKIDYLSSSSSYFVNPDNIYKEIEDYRVDDFTLEKAKKELITNIDKCLEQSKEYKRAVMSRLFYLLPVAFKSPQQIHGYILNSLHQCSNKNEKNASKELIKEIMEEFH